MKQITKFIILIALIASVQSIAYSADRPFGISTTASVAGQTKEARSTSTTIDLSLSFPPYATVRLWLDNKHGFELYPPVRFEFLSSNFHLFYLKYMYRIYDNYYVGLMCLGGADKNGQNIASALLGAAGTEFSFLADWLIADLGVVYAPWAPADYQLFPTFQLGARLKI